MDYEAFYRRIDYSVLTPAPVITWTPELLATCADRWKALQHGKNDPLCRDWIFLEYLVTHGGFLLHGSSNATIRRFEPRAAGNAFHDGRNPRVYASSSGLLATWYAIVDREKLKTLCGAAQFGMIYAPVDPTTGQKRERFFFALGHTAYADRPYQCGTVYVLPRQTFRPEFLELQWYAEESVEPLASLPVSPTDWPFLSHVHAMNFARSIAASKADPAGKIPPLHDRTIFPLFSDASSRSQ